MRKRKFGSGGVAGAASNPANAFAPQGAPGQASGLGAAAMQPQVIMQAPISPPGQQSQYPSPVGTFPRAGFKKGGKVKFKGKASKMAKGNMSVGNISSKTKVGFAKGGSVRSGIDGVAKKGHTKGKDIKMAKGGKC